MLIALRRSVLALPIGLLACASPEPAPPQRFPVFDNANLREIASDPQSWEGRFVGFRGVVEELEPGPKGKPHIRLSARNDAGQIYEPWIGSLIELPDGSLSLGDTIRVVGYFTFIERFETAPGESRRLMGGYHVLAQCVVNETTSVALMLPAGRAQCERWMNGENPERLGRRKDDE